MAHPGYGYQWRPGGTILVPLPANFGQQIPAPGFPTRPPPPPYYPYFPNSQSTSIPTHAQATPTSSNPKKQQAAPPRVRHAHFCMRPSAFQKPNPKHNPKSRAEAEARDPSSQPAHTQQVTQPIRPATVTMHCIHSAVKPWALPHQTFDFEVVVISCSSTVRKAIEKLGGGRKHVITECLELGDGRWAQGVCVAWSDARATRGIGALGWSQRRGVEVGPIWVVVSLK